ncbi:MAG: hypothetical protein HY748_04820 [Elusimicrobia bacterium]|nr:hypothetical protein [Elusimicrobiota bacterium]
MIPPRPLSPTPFLMAQGTLGLRPRPRRGAVLLAALLVACEARLARGQDDFGKYSPSSGRFTCELPLDWHAFEEEEPAGFAVHVLGPDDPAGSYRAGIDVHFVDGGRGAPAGGGSSVPAKQAIETLRRSDKLTGRQSTPVKRFAVGKGLARTFEVWETRFVPAELAPSVSQVIHHFVAVIESGDDYYVIRLSSSEEVYVDLRDVFVRFLKSFRIKGA